MSAFLIGTSLDKNVGSKTAFIDPQTNTQVTCDTIFNGHHLYTNDVTEFPADSGDNITDHVIKKPLELQFSCVISNTPITITDFQVNQNSVAGAKYSVNDSDGSTSAANDAYATLLNFRENRTILTVQTGMDAFENMLIAKLEIDRSHKTNFALYFTITLKNIRIVVSENVQISNLSPKISKKVAPKVSVGAVPATKAEQASVDKLIFNFNDNPLPVAP